MANKTNNLKKRQWILSNMDNLNGKTNNELVRVFRLFANRTWYLPPFADKSRINLTRTWQIKNKINYGRY